MKTSKCAALFLFLCLPACGRQLVEFPKDGGAGASGGGGGGGGGSGGIGDGAVNDQASHDGLLADGANLDLASLDGLDALDALDARDAHDAVVEVVDLGPPVVIATSPALGVTSAPIRKTLTATFSKAMTASTLNTATFLLKQGTTVITGVVDYLPASMKATFVPSADLALGTAYQATITTGAKDLGGQAMASNYSWSFRTSPCALTPVALGQAESFAVLAGAAVTNTGASLLTGDLGVSPGTSLTGFPPGIVVGAQHAGDAAAGLAETDLTAASLDAAGRTLCPVEITGNLGGFTLTPGLYHTVDSLEISVGDLTLDANGDEDSVFIFQMGTTLSVGTGRQVVLTGGAKAANVFWQVGTSASFASVSTFAGTIIAGQSVTAQTGAQLDGRALAQTGAVTLDTNAISVPTP